MHLLSLSFTCTPFLAHKKVGRGLTICGRLVVESPITFHNSVIQLVGSTLVKAFNKPRHCSGRFLDSQENFTFLFGFMFSEIRRDRWKLLGDEAGNLLNVATLESNGARNVCKAIRRCIHTLDVSIATDVPGYYTLR